jgi:hypothetical protein
MISKLFNVMWGMISDSVARRIRLDASTHSLPILEYEHSEIHKGDHYYIEGYAELDNTDTLFIKLVTPNTTKWAHFKWEITSTGVLATTLDEAATGGMTGGSGVTPLNNNRNSANTSGIVITSGVTTCTGYTTRVSNQKFGVASNPARATGGADVTANEIILKQNTVYCRSFTSGSDSNIVNFRASWYEHTNRN